MIPTRTFLESLGIGHPNCALRELDMHFTRQDFDALIPILKCKHLEVVAKQRNAEMVSVFSECGLE